MKSHEHRDRILGIMLGLACGDALGAPLQGSSRYEIEANYGKVKKMLDGGPFQVQPGETTLPTAQALSVADSVIKCKGFEPLDMALGLTEVAENCKFPFDQSTMETLEEVGVNDNWESVSSEVWVKSGGDFCSNQCLTRAPIIGIRNSDNLENLIRETVLACRLTHRDPRVIEASLVIAFLISQLIHDPYEPNFIDRAIHFLDHLPEDEIYRELTLDFDESEVKRNIKPDALHPYTSDPKICLKTLRSLKRAEYDELDVRNDAIHTMAVAVHCLFHCNRVERGIYRAVGLGGETCFQGALAGALAGARFGMSAIPDSWLSTLKDRARIVSLTELLID